MVPAGIWRVSGNGGTPEPVVKIDSGQRAYGPQLLPDGRSLLFTLAQTASWDEAQIVVQSLDSGTRQPLIPGGTDGRYLPTGHLVYALRDTVLTVPFDTTSLRTRGGPAPLVDGVRRQAGALTAAAQFVVSSDGTLAYVPTASVTAPRRTFVWVDRQGREEAIAVPPRSYSRPRLAPDGSRLAVEFEQTSELGHLGVGIPAWDADADNRRSLLRPLPRMDTTRRPAHHLHLRSERRRKSVPAGGERNRGGRTS